MKTILPEDTQPLGRQDSPVTDASGRRTWWARLGLVGFLFFLLKGLLWLLIPAALWFAS